MDLIIIVNRHTSSNADGDLQCHVVISMGPVLWMLRRLADVAHLSNLHPESLHVIAAALHWQQAACLAPISRGHSHNKSCPMNVAEDFCIKKALGTLRRVGYKQGKTRFYICANKTADTTSSKWIKDRLLKHEQRAESMRTSR